MKQLLQTAAAVAQAQFKLKIEGNYLGILWYLLEPLMMFVILMTIRNIVGTGIAHYPVYLFIGLVVFNFFRKTTTAAANCLINNDRLITGVRIHSEVFVLAAVFEGVLVHAFEMLILVGLLVWFGLPLVYLLGYALVFGLFAPFVCGVSFVLAVCGVYFTDINNIWNLLTRLLWFATPIFYGKQLTLPLNLNRLNPMFHFIDFAREIIIYHRLPALLPSIGMLMLSCGFGLGGYAVFKRLRTRLVEKL